MSEESVVRWPLRPSTSAQISHALCMTLADLVTEEGGGEISRRAYLKMCGLATAAELFAREASHWYGTRMGEDHDLLEKLQDRWEAERSDS